MPKGTYELIQDYTATSSTSSSYTFSDIPSNYTDIQAVVYFRTTNTSGPSNLKIYFNGAASTTNYTTRYEEVNTSNAMQRGGIGSDSSAFIAYTSSSSQDVPVVSVIEIPSYRSADEKFFMARHGSYNDFNGWYANRWSQTSAITSITFVTTTGNINTGTRITLYGIKGEK